MPVNSAPVRRKDSQSTPDTAPSRMQKGLGRGRSHSPASNDRGEIREAASPVGEHIQAVQAEAQMDEEIGPKRWGSRALRCLRDSWRHLRGIGGAGVSLVTIDKIQGERGEPSRRSRQPRQLQTADSGRS